MATGGVDGGIWSRSPQAVLTVRIDNSYPTRLAAGFFVTIDRWLRVSVVFVENEDLPAGKCDAAHCSAPLVGVQ